MKTWKAILFIVVLAGCASPPASSPAQLTTRPPITLTNGPFSLTVYSPADEAIVSEPRVDVRGTVSVDAVLTINTEIYILAPGDFAQTVALEEGPNAIQIVASDLNGNEVDLILTITYQP